MHLLGAVSAFTMGRLSDRLGRRFVLLVLGIVGGCLSLTKCGLLNPDDEAASKGPGAHYLEGESRRAPAA